MKILWVSASLFYDTDESQSGVWQKALASELIKVPTIELANISYHSFNNKEIITNFYGRIPQWGLPKLGKNRGGLPPKATQQQFFELVQSFKPEIIHIWGSENPFKMLPFDDKLPGIKVLAIQGVLSSIPKYCLPWFTTRQIISMYGIREFLKGDSVVSLKKSFEKEAAIEAQMILKSDIILTQSEWVESQILAISPDKKYFRIRRILRQQFWQAKKWHEFEHVKPIIFTSSFGYTSKALWILIQALPIVQRLFPTVELRIAGAIGRTDFLGEGYLRFLLRYIKKNNLNVTWVGKLSAAELISELQSASVYVNPSNVESYSNALAEAMIIGTPTVVSYAGAMPELATPNAEALFFAMGDYNQCAYKIVQLLSNPSLALQISKNAILKSEKFSNPEAVANEHLKIYNTLLNR